MSVAALSVKWHPTAAMFLARKTALRAWLQMAVTFKEEAV